MTCSVTTLQSLLFIQVLLLPIRCHTQDVTHKMIVTLEVMGA